MDQDRTAQFEKDWVATAMRGSGQPDVLYQELLAIQTADGGPDSESFKADLKKINADLNAQQALSGLTIEGVGNDDKRVTFSDNAGQWELAKIDGQVTGVPLHSGPRGNVFLGVLSNLNQAKYMIYPNLYDHGFASIKSSNVKQGTLGDCYFMAALAELAAQSPQSVWKMMHATPTGYSVSFPGHEPLDIGKPNPFELEHFAQPADGDWANAIEKAHRKLTGKELVDSGDDPSTAMELLTGQKAEQMNLKSSDQFATELDDAMKRKDLVLASTRDPAANEKYDAKALKLKHAYSVLAYDAAKKVVTIRDPEGACASETDFPCTADGVIQLSLQQFMEQFPLVERCPTGAQPATKQP